METLQNLVRELVILVILGVFLELLLPEGDFRRYVRMVLGLLIIVSVLQAAVSFWHRDLATDLSWVSLGQPDQATTGEIIREGERLWDRGQSQAMGKYEEGLARQIRALAGMNPDLEVAEVRVRLEKGTAGETGRLEEVVLVLDGGGGQLMDKDSIPVAGQPTPSPDPESVTRVCGIVADFYGLAREQVTVEYR